MSLEADANKVNKDKLDKEARAKAKKLERDRGTTPMIEHRPYQPQPWEKISKNSYPLWFQRRGAGICLHPDSDAWRESPEFYRFNSPILRMTNSSPIWMSALMEVYRNKVPHLRNQREEWSKEALKCAQAKQFDMAHPSVMGVFLSARRIGHHVLSPKYTEDVEAEGWSRSHWKNHGPRAMHTCDTLTYLSSHPNACFPVVFPFDVEKEIITSTVDMIAERRPMTLQTWSRQFESRMKETPSRSLNTSSYKGYNVKQRLPSYRPFTEMSPTLHAQLRLALGMPAPFQGIHDKAFEDQTLLSSGNCWSSLLNDHYLEDIYLDLVSLCEKQTKLRLVGGISSKLTPVAPPQPSNNQSSSQTKMNQRHENSSEVPFNLDVALSNQSPKRYREHSEEEGGLTKRSRMNSEYPHPWQLPESDYYQNVDATVSLAINLAESGEKGDSTADQSELWSYLGMIAKLSKDPKEVEAKRFWEQFQNRFHLRLAEKSQAKQLAEAEANLALNGDDISSCIKESAEADFVNLHMTGISPHDSPPVSNKPLVKHSAPPVELPVAVDQAECANLINPHVPKTAVNNNYESDPVEEQEGSILPDVMSAGGMNINRHDAVYHPDVLNQSVLSPDVDDAAYNQPDELSQLRISQPISLMRPETQASMSYINELHDANSNMASGNAVTTPIQEEDYNDIVGMLNKYHNVRSQRPQTPGSFFNSDNATGSSVNELSALKPEDSVGDAYDWHKWQAGSLNLPTFEGVDNDRAGVDNMPWYMYGDDLHDADPHGLHSQTQIIQQHQQLAQHQQQQHQQINQPLPLMDEHRGIHEVMQATDVYAPELDIRNNVLENMDNIVALAVWLGKEGAQGSKDDSSVSQDDLWSYLGAIAQLAKNPEEKDAQLFWETFQRRLSEALLGDKDEGKA